MFDISPIQIIIVLAIALLVFGPKRLPGMGRDLGRGIRDFRSGISGEDEVRPPAATAAGPSGAPHAAAGARPLSAAATSDDTEVGREGTAPT